MFGAAVFDICLDVKCADSKLIRTGCWIILNALIGTALSVYIFRQKDMYLLVNELLFGIMILWTIFTTFSCSFLILRVYRMDSKNLKKK